MKATKRVIGHLAKNYALTPLHYQGREHFLVASELKDKCLLFSTDGELEDVVWEEPGGVMSMVQVPDTDGQFLATLKFYGFNNAGAAYIGIITPKAPGNWQIRTLVELPFVHRIDIVERGGVRWLVACTLKSGHEYDDDWRFPGKVYAAQLPADLALVDEAHPLKLTVLKEGLLKNHGYYRLETAEGPACLICAENGIFRFTPPDAPEGEWRIEQLSQDAASDAVLVDLDGDGEEELGVIAPFHGDRVRVYKKQDGQFKRVFEYARPLPFSHAFYGGPLCGRAALVVGNRAGEQELVVFTYDPAAKTYRAERLDAGCGPANTMRLTRDGRDALVVTNRETDEIALYELEP